MLFHFPDEIFEEILRLSGPHMWGTHPIPYSSYHLPGFTVLDTQRNTLDRLRLFNFPEKIPTGWTILDLGSNTGAISLELARRGATVTGLEFNHDRVAICNKLASLTGLSATFHRMELKDWEPTEQFDFVFCLAVDVHVRSPHFVPNVAKATKKVCYLESNNKNRSEHVFTPSMKAITHRPFRYVNYLGNSALPSDSSQGRPRELYVMAHERFPYVGGLIVEETETTITKHYPSFLEWEAIRDIYPRIAHIPMIPKMTFTERNVIMEKVDGESIKDRKPTLKHKAELIEFINLMHKAGVAHRDLSPKNIIVGESLKVIDWDFVCDAQGITYDLDGKGLDSPRWTFNTHLFKTYKTGPSTADYFGLTRFEINLR